jgi:hypothetical protein
MVYSTLRDEGTLMSNCNDRGQNFETQVLFQEGKQKYFILQKTFYLQICLDGSKNLYETIFKFLGN